MVGYDTVESLRWGLPAVSVDKMGSTLCGNIVRVQILFPSFESHSCVADNSDTVYTGMYDSPSAIVNNVGRSLCQTFVSTLLRV